MAGVQSRARDDQNEVLKPYVPRLQVEWLRDNPQAKHQSVEGSLAFVDISGFTALTESLNRRGKIGAELLRDTLNPIFCVLLDEAYRWGAGLLKWGGDAMLLLFEGPGHERRAARAAWEMQKTIERVGRVRVGSARVNLRMSIGIATGAVDVFLVGTVHRELLVAGPVATETAVVEGTADAGEIGISPALAERLAPERVGGRKGKALLLVEPPEADELPAPDVGRVRGLDVSSCIPIAAREYVLLERSEPEHRAVTAAFFDLMNTDALLAELGAEALADALDERISSIQEAAFRYEVPFNVTDVSKGSVKVLLTAGAPTTTGHDEEQTLRVAREVMDRAGVVPMRAGLDAGHVFTGDFGPTYRRTYAVLGDAINTAARVMARAEAGQILATDVVLERSRTTFATTPIAPFAAKGKAEPVHASLVGRIIGRREERIAETPFVGRGRELHALRGALEEVGARNDAWIVEIAGPSGIGKTRLIREALVATPGLRVFGATCEEYEGSTPYHALREPVRQVLGLAPDSSPSESERALRTALADADPELVPWVPLLGILLGLDLPPTAETEALDERFLRATLADVTCRFLAARLDAKPFVLVVEDAQFMDDSSADLLRRMSKAGEQLPHALVVARTEREGLWTDVSDDELRYVAFNLLPLSEREAAEIVEITTDEQPLRPHEVDELARRSGGSPLFLVELLNVARAAGTTDELPDSVEAVVTADIDRLSPADRIVLRYASVLGVAFEADLLEATLGDDVTPDAAVWERLRGLVDRDADGRLRFRNTLVHDAAYGGLPFRRRRELHGRVGLALESQLGSDSVDGAGALAAHFFHAGDHERAWRYSRSAGDSAKGIYANVDAASFYARALDTSRRFRGATGSEVAAVAESLGDVRYRLGEFEAAADAYRLSQRHLAGDRVEQARLLLKQALIPWRLGRYPQALGRLTRGLRLIDGLEGEAATRERANLFARNAVIRQRQGRPQEAIAWCRRTIEVAEPAAREALAQALYVLDWAYATLGRFDEAVYSERALAIYEELGNLERQGAILNNLGAMAYYQARWTEAVGLYERAQQVWERSGDRWSASFAVVNRAEVLLDQGRLAEAEPLIRDSLRIARASGSGPRIAETARYLGILLARLGRFDEARRLHGEAHDEYERAGESSEVLVTEARIAELLVLEGAAEEALDRAERALARSRASAGIFPLAPTLHRMRGLALLRLGRLGDARAALDESLDGARKAGADYEVALALDALAVLGRLDVSFAGESPETAERERDAIFARLGVVSTPEFPLPPDKREF